jgi:hypothetical protein
MHCASTREIALRCLAGSEWPVWLGAIAGSGVKPTPDDRLRFLVVVELVSTRVHAGAKTSFATTNGSSTDYPDSV